MSLRLLIAVLLLPFTLFAVDGDPDTSFSGDGRLYVEFNNTHDIAYSVVIQSDGKIVLAGKSDDNFALVRYNIDTSLDTTFDTDGRVTTDFGGTDVANAVALQSDGKIVAAGNSDGNFSLARYDMNGLLDTTFDTDGKVTTDLGGAVTANAVALQSDGKIVVAGNNDLVSSGIDGNITLLRYDMNGSLDTAFGSGGIVTTDFGGSDTANAVVMQSDGKIVVAGSSDKLSSFVFEEVTFWSISEGNFSLARYNTDGSLDTAFGSGGMVMTDFGVIDRADAVALQSDGKIVAAGVSDGNLSLARYNTDGSLDTAFGSGGMVIGIVGANSVVVQSNGKIVVTGSDFVARYNSDGSLDTSFGTDGKVAVSLDLIPLENFASAVQSDGKIVTVGYHRSYYTVFDFALSRISADGSVETSLQTNFGKSTTIRLGELIIQDDGNIALTASTTFYGTLDVAYALLSDAGLFELGRQKIDEYHTAGPHTDVYEYITASAQQSDQTTINVGFSQAGVDMFVYLTKVSNDGSFGILTLTDPNMNVNHGRVFEYAYPPSFSPDVAIQSDDKILITQDGKVFRLMSNGNIDTSFGIGGTVSHGLVCQTVAIQNDQKIIIAGESMVRLNSDGSFDTSFSSDGVASSSFTIIKIAIQIDGKIVSVGSSGGNFALSRYNTDGSLDATFGSGGVVTTDFGGSDTAYDVALQSDGKIVVVGTNGSDVVVVRYNKNGSLDTTFGSSGTIVSDFGGTEGYMRVEIDANGKIVIGGKSDKGAFVARYLSSISSTSSGINPAIIMYLLN